MRRAGFRSVVARWISTSRASHGPTRRCYRAAPQLRAPTVPKMGPQGLWNGASRWSSNQVLRVDAVPYLSAVSTEGSVDHQDSVAKLTKFCEEGRLTDAFEAVETMAKQGVDTSVALLSRIAEECLKRKRLAYGRRLHSTVTRRGLELSSIGWNTLIRLYATCGSLEDAEKAFRMIVEPAEYSWQAIILAHANLEQGKQAIELYKEMQGSGVKPNSHIYVAVLKACASTTALVDGREVHEHVIESGLESHEIVANALMNMYAKCCSMADAQKLFDGLAKRDVLAWTVMISGYTEHRSFKEALALFEEMKGRGVEANKVTFMNILKACTNTGALDEGRQIHSQIVASGLETDVGVADSLIAMYCKCGSLQEGRDVFDRMRHKTIVSWNALMGSYGQHGQGQEAFRLWDRLREEGSLAEAVEALDLLLQSGFRVDISFFYSVLKRCTAEKDLGLGRQVHILALRSGYESNAFLANHLIGMYASLERLDEAMQVFDKVAVPSSHMWASIILANARNGQPAQALKLYRCMRQSIVKPDNHIFVAVLKACATAADVASGKEVHADYLGSAVEPNIVTGNCLVDMYAKCGSLEDARRVFDNMPTKDVVTWTAMIAGYVQHEFGQEALALYSHGTGRCLVDMYGKCGSLEDACRVFRSLPRRDVATWNALLNAYAQNSDGKMAMQTFKEMQQQSVEPNEITFNCLLVACCHEGLVDEGQRLFKMMVDEHGIAPDVYHRTSMVDLFGRSGHLDEAESMLQTMPFQGDVVGWTSLLSACKSHGDIERGRRCFDQIVKREPDNAAAYVLLGNLYANSGRWGEVERLENSRKSAGAVKKPARASIEVHKKVETFVVGEERADISSKLRSVNLQLKEEGGHVPHTELVLKPMSEQDKEDALCGHAEKLALAYGLLNTPDGTTLLITKNLRMCNDCHSGTKILSALEGRQIVVRDAHRVHRFVNGTCSCGDRH